jgi:hypothetical protein
MARNSLKMLMAALALAGITGVYLRQVTEIGVLGLLGYVLFAAGYLSMLGTEYVAALVLLSIAHSATAYVNDVIAVANNRPATGDVGLMHPAIPFTGITYIAGGFIFAIALFRANVLARWAAALLALGTLATGNHRSRPRAAVRKAVRPSHRPRSRRPRLLPVARAARTGRSAHPQPCPDLGADPGMVPSCW